VPCESGECLLVDFNNGLSRELGYVDIRKYNKQNSGRSLEDTMPVQSPLTEDANGVIRIGKTRVTLLSVMNAFHRGATPEEIVQQYSALTLAEVYATIAYYLQNRGEVDAYLAEERRYAADVRQANEMPKNPRAVAGATFTLEGLGWCSALQQTKTSMVTFCAAYSGTSQA
jgi:uncharacterized protein (DUF433 family)